MQILHAYLNEKGTLEEIKEISEYMQKCFLAFGLSEETEFILGSSFQTAPDYTLKVYELALSTTLTRARRSMAQITRDKENHKVAEVIYPIMQVIDMLFLDTDVAVGGMEQIGNRHACTGESIENWVFCTSYNRYTSSSWDRW